ncbi:MAG: glycoside hydrolase family 16 protein, partial [Bacteroidia bacterium]|nr:glycoside hydrolase family 16 protein [Bacteroidia bacterium]
MRKRTFAIVSALIMLCNIRVNAAYELVWSDEFNCSNVNTSVWNYELGTGTQGWGNWEQEYYTNSTNNVYTEDGSLVIKAIRDNTQYDPNYNTSFTSGRIKTNAKIQAKYGKIEASIKLPQALKGIWPAFWMLGTGKSTWPYQGEIDIMEYMCTSSSYSDVKSTLHWNANGMNGAYSPADYGLATNVSNPSTQYHTYTMEWTPTTITSYLDGVQYYVINIAGTNFDAFQHEFYILLNMAVGGSFVDYQIDGNFQEAAMYVDWIRVYQDESAYPASSLTNNSTACIDEPVSPYDQILVYCDHNGSGKVMDLRSSNFYIWNNTVTVTSLGSTFEGANSMALTTSSAQGWYGCGFTNTTSRDYSVLNNYSLHFAYYTSSTQPFGVKISDVVYTINPTQTNTWVEAEIPVSSLNRITLGTSSDMLLFGICNGNGETLSDGRLIAFDDVYYYYKEATPSISEVTASPTMACLGSTINFSAEYNSFSGTPTINYAVKNGSGSYTNISGSSYAPTSAGTYTVKATATYGSESAENTTTFTILDKPTVSISPSVNTITCTNTSSVLTASGNNIASYKWDNNATAATRTVTAGGNYSVTVTSSNGCTNTASTTISENK